MIIDDEINELTKEYHSMLKQSKNRDGENKELLISNGDWSPSAAEHLLDLATRYGSFMLRNALALSIALKIEDGELGF